MKPILLISLAFLIACNPKSPQSTVNDMNLAQITHTYLALGDSYTIGEGVPEQDRYPNILVKKLNEAGDSSWVAPEIIAKTGWTVDELEEGIREAAPSEVPYDLVTVLIGVNNQYRGRPIADFKQEFEQLLLKAIGFAGNLPNHVVVLSIPDWGITPFAVEKESDQAKVAADIDSYNQAKMEVCETYGIRFIDITEDYRKIGDQAEMLVEDKLHPSGKVYERWADQLYRQIKTIDFEKP